MTVEKHQIQEGRVDMLEHQIQAIVEEYKALEKKSSLIQVSFNELLYFNSFATSSGFIFRN